MFTHLSQRLGRSVGRAARIAAAAAALTFSAAQAYAQEITGAGATFPGPIYTKWAEQYAKAGGAALNYQGVGSGAGVTQIIGRTVDFGASDVPVAADKLSSNNLLQFPAVIGAVVLVVNVPGVDGNSLKLTGPIVADIYQGKIRMWNDKQIAALNPGVKLPVAAVAPAYRADASGTTNIFTSYLSSVSPTFKANIGAANSVPWKTGVGAPQNAGVAASVKNTRGGIGYVEYAYANENKMQTPMLQNKSGKFVAPSEAAFSASAATANWKDAPNMAVSMLDTAGEANWPIVSATYILMPKNPADPARATRVLKFFDWAFRNGKPAADALHYMMLPDVAQTQVRQSWTQIKGGAKAIWPAS